MRSSRKTKILNCICVGLVLLAGAVRLLGYHYETFSYNSIICVLFTASALIWIHQLQRRLVQTDVRRNLTVCALMMILWMLLRTIKYDFLPDNSIALRYAWYLYYIPQTFCVLMMFFSVLHIGKPQNSPISCFWKVLYIPAVIIVLGILTNDLHQLAFRFPDGMSNWNNNNYIYGPYYYAAVLWIGFLFAAILVIVFVRCAVPGSRRRIWLPTIPLVFGIIYFISYVVDPDGLAVVIIKMPEFVSRQLFEMYLKSSANYELVYSLESALFADTFVLKNNIDLV